MLELYNTMSRSREVFEPREDRRVKIFTCGPSTYRRPHIGNYRTFLYEDILVRYLEYAGYQVERLINFTDVEDKMLEEALKERRSPEAIAAAVAERFYEETRQLRIKLPGRISRSSTSVQQAAQLILKLLDKGVAYWHDGDVFFDPLKFEGFGKLFRLDMSRWPKHKVRFKKDTYVGQRWNLGDFILWHGYREGDLLFWDSPIGRGRPSWNVQDPAMITENLGPQVDINCGGIDNVYRHHDYNIAIMESVSGLPYANYYLHGQHLFVDGRPMSKSRGNIRYLEDLERWGYEPRHVRFFLIYTHYRKRLNLTTERLQEAAGHLDRIRRLIAGLLEGPDGTGGPSPPAEAEIGAAVADFEKHMDEDLSVGRAVDTLAEHLEALVRAHAPLPAATKSSLRKALQGVDGTLAVLL